MTQAFTDRMTANCVSPHEVFDQQRGAKKVLKMRTFCPGPFPLVTNLIRNILAFIEVGSNDEIDEGNMDIDSSHHSLLSSNCPIPK